MRLHRARRKKGTLRLRITITDGELDRFEAAGYLDRADRGDPAAEARAMLHYGVPGVIQSTLSCGPDGNRMEHIAGSALERARRLSCAASPKQEASRAHTAIINGLPMLPPGADDRRAQALVVETILPEFFALRSYACVGVPLLTENSAPVRLAHFIRDSCSRQPHELGEWRVRPAGAAGRV
jgi:hypothetical protein